MSFTFYSTFIQGGQIITIMFAGSWVKNLGKATHTPGVYLQRFKTF